MKKILAVATAIALGVIAAPSNVIGADTPLFDDYLWEVIEVNGPATTIFGATIQSNNVVSLTTFPAGNISAVVRGRHPWIESMGGTAYFKRPDGTYDTITLVN